MIIRRTSIALMAAAVVVVAIAVVLVVAVTAGEDDETSTSIQPQSVDELYERMRSAIHMDDHVLHTTVDVTIANEEGESAHFYTRDIWIDADAGVSRVEDDFDDGGSPEFPAKTTRIVKDRRLYQQVAGQDVESYESNEHCPGDDDPLLGQLLSCGFNYNYDVFERPTFEMNRDFEGRSTIALVWDGVHDERERMLITVYVDPETFLPIAWTGEFPQSEEHITLASATYQHRFVATASVADDFFDPRSLGYVP